MEEVEVQKQAITFMLVDYMDRLKEICEECVINEGLVSLNNELLIVDIGNINNYLMKNKDIESCIDDICYSPFSDTFSIYISSNRKSRKIFDKLSNAFQDIQVDIEESDVCSIIEIQYNKDKFYEEHIQNNIVDIISLKSYENKI